MSGRSSAETHRIALVGNPNTGKTSLFNALTGYRRHVANFPGVTVEIATGRLAGAARPVEIIDLPGTYSLAALSPDERIVGDVLSGHSPDLPRPDAIVAVLDASNLPRNLYLLSQVIERGLPMVIALSMSDVAAARGLTIDVELLSRRLGVPVVPIVANDAGSVARLTPYLSSIAVVAAVTADRFVALPPGRAAEVPGAPGLDAARAEVQARYAWIANLLDGVLARASGRRDFWSDRIDRVLTNGVSGGIVLLLVLLTLFQAVFSWAGPLMDGIDAVVSGGGDRVASVLPEGVLRSLLVDGLIAGVGGVMIFLPQILILFAFIGVLEDCGYMARAAFMMDRLMRGLGLSGRAFIPLLSSFACAVPAILGTRTIADRRERITTILIAPFMSCSARLPVYVLMISAFVPPTPVLGGVLTLQAVVMMGAYLLGVVVAVPIAWLLRKSLLRGGAGGFLLELPSYKLPGIRNVSQRMYVAGRGFVLRAGTIIVAVNLVVWALGYFPRSAEIGARVREQAASERWEAERVNVELAGAQLRESYLGRLGRFVEPIVAPIGWDWRIAMATLASFPAREVIIATLGTIYNLGAGEDEQSPGLRAAIAAARGDDGRPVFTLPVALSIIVFFALCAQCSSTLVVMAKETGSWGWPLLSFFGMTAIAYVGAWATAALARAAGL